MVDGRPDRFEQRYELSGADVMVEIEREALGSDYRANGYTGPAQADEIGERLGLGPDSLLLDLGSGCGWPGLHFAQRNRCRVVGVDPVEVGVAAGRDRARRDGLADRHLGVVAGGEHLPLRPGAFDAVVHVDVLC